MTRAVPDASPASDAPEPSSYRFVSTAHPGAAAWQWVYGRALVRPLAVCALPLMIGALVTVLQGYPALAYLTIGLPAVMAVAMGWTFFRMYATIVEIHVRPGAAAVRTIWETLRAAPLRWGPIFELRTTKNTLTLALGDAAYELDRAAWPDAETLLHTLQAARAA